MNTFFEKAKHRKWTWARPEGNTKNEIDFIIADKKQIIQYVTVLNRSVESNHRMARSTARFNEENKNTDGS